MASYGDWFSAQGGGFDVQSALRQIAANPNDSGYYGKPVSETGSYFKDGYWITPIYGGQTFDQSSGTYSTGPLQSYRITKDLGKTKGTNIYGGGGSVAYTDAPYLEVDPSGNVTGQNAWAGHMGTGDKVDAAALATAIAATMGAGAAVAGTAGAAGAAGSGAGAGGGAAATVPTAAEAAAGSSAFASEFSPYLAQGGTAAGSGVFNAAMDSQAANAAIQAAGGNALEAYSAAGIPSTTISNLQSAGLWDKVTQYMSPTTLRSMLSTGSTIADIAGVLAPLVGGAISANAAGSAADAQLQAQREAQALMEPFRIGGVEALNRQRELLGIGGDRGAADYGSLAKSFTNADFVKDPGYEFRMKEGQKALQNSAAARGGLFSGAAGKAISRYGQDYASNEFMNAYNRYNKNRDAILNPLQSLSGQGLTSSGQMAGYASNAGDAQAAGKVGQANAFTDSLGQAYNNWRSNENRGLENAFMERLLTSRGAY